MNNVLSNFYNFILPKPKPVIFSKYIFSFIIQHIYILDKNNYQNESTLDDKCPICYNIINFKVRPNCCYHYFCSSCILHWIRVRNTCPTCRKNINYII